MFLLRLTLNSLDTLVCIGVQVAATIGPLQGNVDLVARYNTSLKTNRAFYTDSNCLEMQRRWYIDGQASPMGGNFFPAACGSELRDAAGGAYLSVLSDRTQSASGVLADGLLDIMVHRRLFATDDAGPLYINDTGCLAVL